MNYCRQRENFSADSADLLVYLGRCMAGGGATTAHTEKKRGGGTYWLGQAVAGRAPGGADEGNVQ